eukprot:scaffold335096_cov66-Attheya_sp.AAC.1
MDEEDHEALVNLFTTIGKKIDKPGARDFMRVCFKKIDTFIRDQRLSSRTRFMYQDLVDVRAHNWKPRRKEEKAKTLDEIRQDAAREEAQQAQQSAQGGNYRNDNRGGGGGGGRGSSRDDHRRDDHRRDDRHGGS